MVIVKDVTLHKDRSCQICFILKGMNLTLKIKTMGICAGRCQPCRIY